MNSDIFSTNSPKIFSTTNNRTKLIYLETGKVWSSQMSPGSKIMCLQGVLWITQLNHIGDLILLADREFLPSSKGKVVVEALEKSTIVVVDN